MPELPEVETVRRGLVPAMQGEQFARVELSRPDLRFPFPDNFAARLTGARVDALDRRGKYVLVHLDSAETLIMHLGMSGRFTVLGEDTPGQFVHSVAADGHVHAQFFMAGEAAATVAYSDPRRFGFMDLVPTDALEACRHFAKMGPEPLSGAFSADSLLGAVKAKSTPLKLALLDQAVVAGLGNIYVCEALYLAGLSPRRQARTLGIGRATRLVAAIKEVLTKAIEAGGSSLRDYAAADGSMGRFQHSFSVYGREGEPCDRCGEPIKRIVQSGRSTFFCSGCQR